MMQHLKKVRTGLAAKLAISLVAGTAAFSVIWGYFNIRDLRRRNEAEVRATADRITEVIRSSTHYQMLHHDREGLRNIIQEIGRQSGINRIRIFDRENRIQISTGASEVGTTQTPPAADRIFTGQRGERLLGVVRPIDNMPACSQASCHSHPAGQRVLGLIDANLSLARVDAEASAQQQHLVVVTLLAAILVSAFGVLFIWIMVYKPVKELMVGTHRVADGDLDYRLPIHSADELGDLAASFNKMTADLAAAHGEITSWAHTLEQRVEQKTQELESAHKTLLANEKMASIGKLAATVAHEVNNPLFGILTYARLTLKKLSGCAAECPAADADKAEMAQNLDIIERESKRCGDIMRNLLTFARQAPSHRDINDVHTIIGRAVLLVRHKLDLQQIQLTQQLGADVPSVDCDGNQIQQVILVLLVNAAEAMPSGGRIEIHTACEAGFVRIRVRDNGPGIPAEVLPKIFEPFFTTKEDQLRTGLGLAVAKSIVEQHGGEITVQSKPGEGTEFLVTLPAPQTGGALKSREHRIAADTAGYARPLLT
jgi:two-component system NtrC family sensor kinase